MMPIVDIVGRLANSKTFYIIYAFISDKKEGAY